MTSPGNGGREGGQQNSKKTVTYIANSVVFTVTWEGGRCENGRFCGDVIFGWPLTYLNFARILLPVNGRINESDK